MYDGLNRMQLDECLLVAKIGTFGVHALVLSAGFEQSSDSRDAGCNAH